MNLFRRDLGPVSCGKMFEMLLKVRGIGTGQGARNDATSSTVDEVEKELGVSHCTAVHRRELARELEGRPVLSEWGTEKGPGWTARPLEPPG